MSDFTARAGLRLPGGGSTGTILPDEQVDIDVLNDNFRKIDTLLGARKIPSASSYAGSMDGDLVYAEDTEYLQLFSSSTGALITPRHPGANFYKGTIAQRDAATLSGLIQDGDHWQVVGEVTPSDNNEYIRMSGNWSDGYGAYTIGASVYIGGPGWTALVQESSWVADSGSSTVWNNGIVIPTDGTYSVEFALYIDGPISNTIVIKLNNTIASASNAIAGSSVATPISASTTYNHCSITKKFAAGDVLTPAAWSGQSGPFGLAQGQTTRFSVKRL